MDMTIDQQVELDEALVPHASRLRIGKRNFRLRSDITSKESTLQLVYDVLRLTTFYMVFLVTTDVPEIYMQEFWATAIIHHHSIRFKMDNKKHIVNLEHFREMLHIYLRLPNQTFDELPFEEEILAFLRYLGHIVINKYLIGKSTGYDSFGYLRLRFFRECTKKNVDFAYLMWEDFVYQVEHKDVKKSNEKYYPRFKKVIIHYFMNKDPLISRRNKVNWHYVRDDQMFTTIKLVSRHQNTQQFGVMFPVERTNEDIRNSEAYKEYYATASGAVPPKTKASVRKTKSSSDTTITPPIPAGTRLSTSAKGKQPTKSSKASGSGTDEGTGIIPGVPNVLTDESDEEISWKSSDEDDDDEVDDISDDQEDDDDQDDDDQDDNNDDQDTDNDGNDFVHPKLSIHEEEAKDEESFDPIVQTPENTDDEGNDDASLSLNVASNEGQDAEDDDEELYRDVNINLNGRDVQMTDVHTTKEFEDTHVSLTPVNPDGQQQSSSVLSQFVTIPQAPTPPTTALSTFLQDLPNFGSLFEFDHRLKTLEANFSEFLQTNQFAGAISSILKIIKTYMDQRMNEAVKEQVKEHVKVQVFKILLKIKKTVNEQLEAEVLTRSSNSSKTSYAMAADLSKMELKKILIEKMESKKWHDDANKDEEPSAGSDRGPREEEKEKSQNQQALQRERRPRPLGISHWGRKRQQFYRFIVNRESARDVYSKRRIIAVTELQIIKCHNYKHLDWTTSVKDLQLGVKCYQKKLNLTKLDMYHSNLKRKEAYTAYSNPTGFIYQNKDKQNRLMRIDELHKFSDGTLNEVRTALDDHLKGIRIKYLPQTI
nr:hypothetical protein [Tanacetum cinerariifolium]